MKTKLAVPAGILLALGATAAGIAVLYCFNPEQYGFYPQCLFYRLTGVQCPGCGNTRALHALLHGELRQSLHYNLMLLPTMLFIGTLFFLKGHKILIVFTVWLTGLAIFTVVRNIL